MVIFGAKKEILNQNAHIPRITASVNILLFQSIVIYESKNIVLIWVMDKKIITAYAIFGIAEIHA